MTDWLHDQRLIKVVVVVVALFATRWLYQSIQGDSLVTPEQLLDDVPAPELLTLHTEEFNQGVVKVTDGIYMAIGYALANSILIEAPEGAIIVDTTESMDAGREIYAAFRNITNLPIKVIVYTHNHADHMYGTAAFIDESLPPEIWAHETLPYLVDATSTVLPLTFSRAAKQFGTKLREVAPKAFRNSGIGPYLRISEDGAAVLIPPTHLMSGDKQDVLMAGLPVTLVHIPGETTDQMGMWIPSKKAFLCGDDLYRTFPNLYAIRGTPTRDTLDWVSSVDKIISYEPEFIVPSHSRHLEGWEYINSVLTGYRDAIKLVHDQTVRYMNKGMLPDDIVTKVQLPESLSNSPFLHTFYGTFEWSVRAVFDRYMGWFSGNIVELSRHSTVERAKRMISLAGGEKSMVRAAKDAIDENDFKWALELATQVITVDSSHSEAKEVRLTALKALASQQMSANGRNYYLSVALEDYGFVDTKVPPMMRKAAIMFMKPHKLFEALSLRLKAEEAEGVNAVAVFNLTDIDDVYALRIRNSVMDVLHGEPEEWKIKVTVKYETWKGIVAGNESPLTLYMSGALQVEGGMMEFKQFMGYLDAE